MTINVDMLTPAVTGLMSSSSPSLGQAVTIAATVATAVPTAGTPTGSVDFTDTTTGNDLGTFPWSAALLMLPPTNLPWVTIRLPSPTGRCQFCPQRHNDHHNHRCRGLCPQWHC